MSAEYVITDDETQEVIPQGMPHWEVNVDRMVNGIKRRYPALHFLSLTDVWNFMKESPDVVEFQIRKR